MDITTCLRMTEGQQECWQSLLHDLTIRLETTEAELQKTHHICQNLEAQRNQLQESLEEQQSENQALLEASTVQARQFSETLRQLRLNQAQIVQAEKMSSLGQLVAGIAHEINNPINFVNGNLTHAADYTQDLMRLLVLYQTHYPQPALEIQAEAEAIDLNFLMEDLPHLLASMKVGAKRVQQIVLSLRNFSRMDEAEIKAVDIHEGIDNTLLILQNRLKANSDRSQIQIIKNYRELPLVECYAGQLNQVFMNLLSNAIDALETQGSEEQKTESSPNSTPTIKIQTEILSPDRVLISIADNGVGISETTQQRLFDPFFTTKPVGKGTGLGLSISYQIVTEKHGGSLKCISQPGKGAEFRVEIPLRSRLK